MSTQEFFDPLRVEMRVHYVGGVVRSAKMAFFWFLFALLNFPLLLRLFIFSHSFPCYFFTFLIFSHLSFSRIPFLPFKQLPLRPFSYPVLFRLSLPRFLPFPRTISPFSLSLPTLLFVLTNECKTGAKKPASSI